MQTDEKHCNKQSFGALNSKIDILSREIYKLTERIEKLETGKNSANKEEVLIDIRDLIAKEITTAIFYYFVEEQGRTGIDAENVALRILAHTGIVSICTEYSTRAFIYALNPTPLIEYDNNRLWQYVSKTIKHNTKYDIGISKFKIRGADNEEHNIDEYYGLIINPSNLYKQLGTLKNAI